jgi:hypothetical protein
MSRFSELSNLLPASKSRALRREYFVRLVTVTLGLATLVVIIHGVLLLPAYLFAHTQVAREQSELDRIASSASSAQERAVKTEIQGVKADIAYLGRLGTQPTASGAIRAVLAVPHPGITLSGFTFTAPSKTEQTHMTVTGTASTRDALRMYVSSLSQLSYVSKADLPISAYAKDSAIPFTVTLTGSLKP